MFRMNERVRSALHSQDVTNIQTGNIDLQIDIFISHKGRWNMWLAKARSQVVPLQ
jgi:hypothetical protein